MYVGRKYRAAASLATPSKARPSSKHDVAALGEDTPHVTQLIAMLVDADRVGTYHLLKNAVVNTLESKRERYKEWMDQYAARQNEEVSRVRESQSRWKTWANAAGTDNNWSIFEHLSSNLLDTDQALRIFSDLHARTDARLKTTLWNPENAVASKHERDGLEQMRLRLLDAVHQLTGHHSQPDVVDACAEIVISYLHEPAMLQEKFLNAMFVGAPGTGKTTIARAIATVFASAGMFLESNVIEASRNDFIGQHLGETTPKTMGFLLSALDGGVVFIDEAYALTSRDAYGKHDAYGVEFASALVQFMTTYKGHYCLLVAGYKEQMVDDFLSANEGLMRRIPFRFELTDVSPEDLVVTFQRNLLKMQRLSVPSNPSTVAQKYFSKDAYLFLLNLIKTIRAMTAHHLKSATATPKTKQTAGSLSLDHPLARLFENQYGSITNLSETAMMHLLTRRKGTRKAFSPPKGKNAFSYIAATNAARGTGFPTLRVDDMVQIVFTALRQSSFNDSEALQDYTALAEAVRRL